MTNLKPKVYYKNISSEEAELLKLRNDEHGFYSRSTKIQASVNKHIEVREARRYRKKQYKKQYDKINKEKIIEYYKANKEKKAEYQAQYHKKVTKEKRQQYHKNKPMIKCECCNKEFNKDYLKRHKTTQKYIDNNCEKSWKNTMITFQIH
jgi:hypothetical protein